MWLAMLQKWAFSAVNDNYVKYSADGVRCGGVGSEMGFAVWVLWFGFCGLGLKGAVALAVGEYFVVMG